MRAAVVALSIICVILQPWTAAESIPAFYHRTDAMLEFFQSTALKLPHLVRCVVSGRGAFLIPA